MKHVHYSSNYKYYRWYYIALLSVLLFYSHGEDETGSVPEMWEAESSFEIASYFTGVIGLILSLFPSLFIDLDPFWLSDNRLLLGVPFAAPFARGPVAFFEPMDRAGLGLELVMISWSAGCCSWNFLWSCKVHRKWPLRTKKRVFA